MAIVTPSNAAMGPGTLYVADFGATEPAESSAGIESTPGAGWVDCGGTLGGITFGINQDFKNLEFDQVPMYVGGRKTKETVTVKAKLGEVTLDNLVLAMNGGVLTPLADADKFEPDMGDSSNEPDYKALIFDGYGAGGFRRRVVLRKTLNTDTVEVTSDKDTQQVYAVTFTCYYVSSSVLPYVILQATSGS